jgi:hypothetical protein
MKIFLMGVSFALLDLAEKYSPDLSGAIIMETGGMKGRRKRNNTRRASFGSERRFKCRTFIPNMYDGAS